MFKGRFPEFVEVKKERNSCPDCMLSVTNVRVGSVVEPLYREETDCVHSSDKAVHYTNDIALILNQKRLDKMTLSGFAEYLNDAQRMDDPLRQIRSQLKDEQLFQFVKSRFVQSPSELKAWYGYLNSNLANVVDDYNQSVLAKQAQKQSQQPVSSPASAASAASSE